MKKYFLLTIITLLSFIGSAQQFSRVLLKGEVIAPLGGNAADINIFNKNTGMGTFTNDDGLFVIAAQKGDVLIVSALQYQVFSVAVTAFMLEEQKVIITLRESVNQLEPVKVSSTKLSGDIIADVNKIDVMEVEPLSLSSIEIVQTYDYQMAQDKLSPTENIAMEDHYLKYGLNIANVFRLLLHKNSDKKTDKNNLTKAVDKLCENNFIKEQLQISPEEMEPFLAYVKENNWDENLLKKENQLDLLAFLLEKSKDFRLQQQDK
ncbi:MAG: hypothetical protein ACTJGD_10825 [Mesonia hippocampi]|uniref:hypothetical protein n=1 Tax=Mesonia hippocampi TaxID=1628250 RepID=UPI003F9BA9ED